MPTEWWNKEIGLFEDIKVEIESKCNPDDCPHPYGTCVKCKADGEYITQSAGDEIRQKNYDLISRQAVIKAVDAHTNEDGTLDDDISVILEDIPSVNPIKQKKDPWIGDKPHAKDGFVVNCCSKY